MEEFYLKYIASKLHDVRSLAFGLILGVLTLAGVDGFFEKILQDPLMRFPIYGVLLLLWVLYWTHYRFCYPKNKKNRVGLVIAVFAESDHEQERLKSDFISQLQKNISDQGFSEIINIIVLKNHLSETIKEPKDLKRLHAKVKGHFYLYGKIKLRNDGQSTYFLDLDGMVMHRPIDIKVSSALSKDFITVLPKQVSFVEALEFRGFQFTTNIVYLAVKYITGIAAYLSGDPFLAIRLHTGLKDEFNQFRPLPPNLQVIRDRTTNILSDEELLISRVYYQNGDLPKADEWLAKAFQTNPNNYGAWLFKAVRQFQIDKDPNGALKSIKKAKSYAKMTHEWRYSEAFLKFWTEDYVGANKSCEKLVASGYQNEQVTIAEVEGFNLALLKDPNLKKPQLYYWLGFINYKKKNNLPKALEYFEEFERRAAPPIPTLKQKSTAYIREIKKSMSIK